MRDNIIALSEEYNIITPFTSFLVLESDADRERFKVKRRFQIRDGALFSPPDCLASGGDADSCGLPASAPVRTLADLIAYN